ncbi:MAG: hypothetical protein IJW21_07935 [Clostridia bacterium]|nr:hypothetical protein [Clostridia bacterium]
MNAAGYDVATLGNHEFDYAMQGCMDVIEWTDFPYTSCNFYREADGVRGDTVLDSYVMFDCGDEKVAQRYAHLRQCGMPANRYGTVDTRCP